MGTGIFVVVGASKPSQHSMKISILVKSVECCDAFAVDATVFVAGGTVFAAGETVFAHMTQSAVKSHNGPADRLQSVGGACR